MSEAMERQRNRGNWFKLQNAAFGGQILCEPHKTSGPQQTLAVKWSDGCWLGFNTRAGEHILSDKEAVTASASGGETEKNAGMLLGIVGNPWSQDGRVEVELNAAAPARTFPMVNPGEEPTKTES